MELRVLGSSSAGNCYILSNKEEVLLLEAGLPYNDIAKALDFDFSSVVGCLVSHRHGDHSKTLPKLDGMIDIYCGEDVAKAKSLRSYRPLKHLKQFKVGGFIVLPFDAIHDVPCFGFFIKHEDMGKLVFITDSAYSDYRFKGIDHLMVECNYDADSLGYAVENGITPRFQVNRLLETHMELEETMNVIRNNKDEGLKNVMLLHLSARNSSEDTMVDRIQGELGITPYIAKGGLVIKLKKTPY